jgi:hypothetical protein
MHAYSLNQRAGSWLDDASSTFYRFVIHWASISAAAEHAHTARPPSARKIVRILTLSYAARLVGG